MASFFLDLYSHLYDTRTNERKQNQNYKTNTNTTRLRQHHGLAEQPELRQARQIFNAHAASGSKQKE